ncbi:hypothetical protein [Haloferula sp. BvORR071]|uniref:hypothetical protein n=1 Tax=Haloferula sp. BvORR071 TaxID=1396141 RepID=UPI00054D86B2|nr:hypothetical protein [Haloferula sp. BvORR071]
MRWLEKLERKLDWLHFRGLFKWLAFLGAITFAASYARPLILLDLVFFKEAILSGQVWRLFSFVLIPFGSQPFTPMGVVFMFFGVSIAVLINDSLEGAWGSTRMTLYLLATWFCLAAAQFFFDLPPGVGAINAGMMFYTSVFLAFATLFPKVEFRLFFLLPVEVRILGWLAGILLLANGILHPETLLITVPALIPYGLWVLPGVIQSRKTLVNAVARRRKFTISKGPESEPFHVCEVCRRNERDPADLEFFVMPDGKEYCSEHLPKQP